jgi:uncharacterized membrane protein
MTYCNNCGTKIQDGVKFCPSCGRAAGAAGTQQQTGVPQQQGYAPQRQSGYSQSGDDEANKSMAIIAYILFFIPLLAGAHNTSPFVKYHTNQGTVLFIASFAYGIVYGILALVLVFIPVIGRLLIAVLPFVPLVLVVLGIVNAANGKMEPLPIIGGVKIIK